MKKALTICITVLLLVCFYGCARSDDAQTVKTFAAAQSEDDISSVSTPDEITDDTEQSDSLLLMTISGTPVKVLWEDNDSVSALRELTGRQEIVLYMDMNSGFEQVGSLPESLPSDDQYITAQAGDVVLYDDNQLVVFYGSNTWAYTRLGSIVNVTDEELRSLLSNEDAVITLSVG